MKYTVKKGDTLSKIAEQFLGSEDRWHELWENNDEVIGIDPDLIYPGQVLEVPFSLRGFLRIWPFGAHF